MKKEFYIVIKGEKVPITEEQYRAGSVRLPMAQFRCRSTGSLKMDMTLRTMPTSKKSLQTRFCSMRFLSRWIRSPQKK